MNNNTEKVSIVVPTYNNQKTIGVCLESIRKQSYDNIETIVVDGGSTDFTINICNKFDVELIESELGRSAARILGTDHASGTYLFHVDSDMELTPKIVEECVSEIENYDALVVPEKNIGDTFWARSTDVGKSLSRKNETGNLRFISRDLYYRVGCHNPDLIAKEDEELHALVEESGASIGCINEIIHHHIGNVTFTDVMVNRWKYIKSLDNYEQRSRSDRSPQHLRTPSNSNLHLKDELKERPVFVLGYFFIETSTALLSQLYQRLL